MQYDNPAARLLAILTTGRGLVGTDSCRKAWAVLLETPEKDAALLVSRIGKLMGLPQEIIGRTRELYPNQRPTWQHWSGQVSKAFSTQNLNGHWSSFIHHIDDHTINYLANATEMLEAKSSIKQLDESSAVEIREKISLLIRDLSDSELDAEIKKYILHHLHKILISIDEYKITGALPILDAVECTIGHAYLDKTYRDALIGTEFGREMLDALAATANLVTVAVGIPQLADTILKLTGHG
jgi:hypothetical protein